MARGYHIEYIHPLDGMESPCPLIVLKGRIIQHTFPGVPNYESIEQGDAPETRWVLMGRGRKGVSTKVHLALSTAGIHSTCLSEGQRIDMKVLPKPWELGEWAGIQYVIADTGYNYIAVRTPIRKAEKIPVIPRRAHAIFPGLQDIYKPYYRTRSAIERFFGRIKENKRLALRFEKLDHPFFSFFA